MKNLLIHINPKHTFTPECSILIKIQIENSLRLGWSPDDILLVTNFPYQFMGVVAMQVADEFFYKDRPLSIKTLMVPHLLDMGILSSGEICWNHDFDAFQAHPFTDFGLGGSDAGLTDYGWQPRYCMGSYFFKNGAYEIFEKARPIIMRDIEDEDAIFTVLQNKRLLAKTRRLNITYNIGQRHIKHNISKAIKPYRVFHFHPRKKAVYKELKPYIPKELKKIMVKYGYR